MPQTKNDNNNKTTTERVISEINTNRHKNYAQVSNVVNERPSPKNTTVNNNNNKEE